MRWPLFLAFGTMKTWKNGLIEMLRVLKPVEIGDSGVFKTTCFSFKQLYNTYFKYVLPFIGRLTSRDVRAYTYLFESVQAFPEGDDFTNILYQNRLPKPIMRTTDARNMLHLFSNQIKTLAFSLELRVLFQQTKWFCRVTLLLVFGIFQISVANAQYNQGKTWTTSILVRKPIILASL